MNSSGSRSNWFNTAFTDAATPGITAAAWTLTNRVTCPRSARRNGRTSKIRHLKRTSWSSGLPGTTRIGVDAGNHDYQGSRYQCGTKTSLPAHGGKSVWPRLPAAWSYVGAGESRSSRGKILVCESRWSARTALCFLG
jgi:hypothetical protein